MKNIGTMRYFFVEEMIDYSCKNKKKRFPFFELKAYFSIHRDIALHMLFVTELNQRITENS